MSNFTFDDYVCIGDTSTITVDGYELTARIELDEESRPTDCDGECYTLDQVQAWECGEWFYCGVVLSVSYNGCLLDDHAASLWAIEANIIDGNDHIAECANELIQEALRNIEVRRQEILNALS